MSAMMRAELIQRLKDLDEEASLLFGEAERLHMVIVGGGALILMELLPRDHWILWNIHIIRLGRTICKAIKPDCENCFLKDLCDTGKKK